MKKFGTPTGTGPGSASDIVGLAAVGTPCLLRIGAGVSSSRLSASRRSGEIVRCERVRRRAAHPSTTSNAVSPSLLKLTAGFADFAAPRHPDPGDVTAGPAKSPGGSRVNTVSDGLGAVAEAPGLPPGAGAGSAACGLAGSVPGAVAVWAAGGSDAAGVDVVGVGVVAGGVVVVAGGLVVVAGGAVVVAGGVVAVAVAGGVVAVVPGVVVVPGGAAAASAALCAGCAAVPAGAAVSCAPAARRLPPSAIATTPAVHSAAATRLRLVRVGPAWAGDVMSCGLLAMDRGVSPAEATALLSAIACACSTPHAPMSIDRLRG
jgi:hypothetical protein